MAAQTRGQFGNLEEAVTRQGLVKIQQIEKT
jgi:hypothetical protein